VAVTPDGAHIIGNANTGSEGLLANRRKILSNIEDKVTKYD
jgi:hypothetical protein